MNKSGCDLKSTTSMNIVPAYEGSHKIEHCTSTVNDASTTVNDDVYQSNETQLSKVAKTSADDKSNYHPQRSGYDDNASTLTMETSSTPNEHSSSRMNIYPIVNGKFILFTQEILKLDFRLV